MPPELIRRDERDGPIYLVSRHPAQYPRHDLILFLRRVPLFASLDTEQLLSVTVSMVTRPVQRGELITVEGWPTEALYIVAFGSFKRFKTSRKGREQVLCLLGRGDSFGEVSLLDGEDDFASTQALERGELYALSQSWFRSFVDEVPDFVRELNRFLAAQVRHAAGLVEELSFRHIPERVARLVLEQSGDPSRPHLTQADMAGVTGTTREVVARALRELERCGAITVHRGHISVRDPAELRHIAEGGDGVDNRV